MDNKKVVSAFSQLLSVLGLSWQPFMHVANEFA